MCFCRSVNQFRKYRSLEETRKLNQQFSQAPKARYGLPPQIPANQPMSNTELKSKK